MHAPRGCELKPLVSGLVMKRPLIPPFVFMFLLQAALMTGRYSTRVGVWLTYGGRHHLRADEVTMADVFSAAGYRTAVFGKWHLGDNYPFRPQDRGFHESFIHGGGVVGEAPDWGAYYVYIERQ